jgi:hypothetical protein
MQLLHGWRDVLACFSIKPLEERPARQKMLIWRARGASPCAAHVLSEIGIGPDEVEAPHLSPVNQDILSCHGPVRD